MQKDLEREGLKRLARIEKELSEISERTTPRRSFFAGLWQGAGWVVGSIIAITLIGWMLSLFGVLPGFQQVAHYLQGIVDARMR